jgi:3-methyladenine DNA glycosylase/8-oxoguanine DNA glycosylase
VVLAALSAQKNKEGQSILLSIAADGKLSAGDQAWLAAAARYMLRLDEDLSEFYEHCRAAGGVWQNIDRSTGLLLRSPSLFEDMLKVICTTNIQWGGTKRMVSELVNAFGKPFLSDPTRKTFPTPAAIAQVPFDEFARKVNLGYRAGYVHGLACQFASGEIEPQALQDETLATADLRKKLLAVKGIGAYAAASILMLLGRYDFIPVDSIFRQFMAEKYFGDRPFNLKEAEAFYNGWGKWKYLAYWFEMLAAESASDK